MTKMVLIDRIFLKKTWTNYSETRYLQLKFPAGGLMRGPVLILSGLISGN